jgi:hypothetical protein
MIMDKKTVEFVISFCLNLRKELYYFIYPTAQEPCQFDLPTDLAVF